MKLLFFDIDGTLVSFASHQIPQSAIEALKRARLEGNKVIIATGRPTAIINNLGALQAEGLIDGYVTMNGAYCYVGDQVLYKSPIPGDDVSVIAQKSKEWGVPCIFVHEHEMCEAGRNDVSYQVFAEHLNAPHIPTTDYMSPLNEDIYQITPFFDASQEAMIKPLTPECEYGRWHPAFVDITARGNNKAHGIDIIADYYGLSVADTLAFGDGGNDIPMLIHAGTGIAMGNAGSEVKRIADYVTTSVDDDGIKRALEHYGII